MKKIVINGDFLAFDTFAGVSRYATEIIKELDKIVSGLDIILLTPEYSKVTPNYQNINVVKYGSEPILKWKNKVLRKYIKKFDALLVDLTQAFPIGVHGITCIHDCIPELVPSAYSGFLGKYIRKPIKLAQRKSAIKNSTQILTVSNFSKKDLMRIYHISPDKITVIGNAWQHIKRISYDDRILHKYCLEHKNFYFTLGSRVPHKNLKWIIEAAKQNSESIFVVSGENKFQKNFSIDSFPKNIIFTGYISDEEVKSLMANCKAFILPSIYEGFGIPPLEALAEGSPIIVSNKACLPEIYENSAHYIDPLNYQNIDLNQILAGKVDSGEAVLSKYSWEKSAKKLYEVIIKCTEKM